MTIGAFKSSLSAAQPPDGVPKLVQALWYDAKDDWHKAHSIAQDIESDDGAWVHAYLHRKEGDHGNAGYWYRRAGKSMPRTSLEEEWESIARKLLQK